MNRMISLVALAIAGAWTSPALAGPCFPPPVDEISFAFLKKPPSTASYSDPFDPRIQSITKRWDLRNTEPKSLETDTVNKKEGRSSLKITVHHGDMQETGETADRCSERAEITEHGDLTPAVGADLWYGFQFYVPADLPPIDRRLVLAQVKQYKGKKEVEGDPPGYAAGNPVMAFRLRQVTDPDTQAELYCFSLTPGNEDATHKKHIGVIQLTRAAAAGWHSVAIHVRIVPTDAKNSKIEMWWDGSKVPRAPGFAEEIAIGYKKGKPTSYFKMGPYRDQALPPEHAEDPEHPEVDKPWTFNYDIFQRHVSTPREIADQLAGRLHLEEIVVTPPKPAIPLGPNNACVAGLKKKENAI